MSSAAWIVGSEVATTWISRTAMNMPRHIAPKPAQALSEGFGPARLAAYGVMAGWADGA